MKVCEKPHYYFITININQGFLPFANFIMDLRYICWELSSAEFMRQRGFLDRIVWGFQYLGHMCWCHSFQKRSEAQKNNYFGCLLKARTHFLKAPGNPLTMASLATNFENNKINLDFSLKIADNLIIAGDIAIGICYSHFFYPNSRALKIFVFNPKCYHLIYNVLFQFCL